MGKTNAKKKTDTRKRRNVTAMNNEIAAEVEQDFVDQDDNVVAIVNVNSNKRKKTKQSTGSILNENEQVARESNIEQQFFSEDNTEQDTTMVKIHAENVRMETIARSRSETDDSDREDGKLIEQEDQEITFKD